MENLSSIIGRFEKRQKATQKALDDLNAILSKISAFIPDKVTGYRTSKTFEIKFSYWDGHNWAYPIWDDACFGVIDGTATILAGDRYTPVLHYTDIPDLDYINLKAAVLALDEFFEKLSSISTFEDEAQKLESIRKILEQ